MKLWCLFLVFLISISSTSSWYLPDYHDAPLSYPDLEYFPSIPVEEARLQRSIIVKRSQRNANILYRYCRRNGQPPHFCLKYAVRMIFATGH